MTSVDGSVRHGRGAGYRGSAGLELREDLWVDHVQLSLDLVAPDVVGRAHVLVQDQMFCRGRKPATSGEAGQSLQVPFQVPTSERSNLSIQVWY